MGIKIRKAKQKDAEEASKLICETLSKVNSKDYGPSQVQVIQAHNTPRNLLEKMAQTDFFVAVDGEVIVGTILLNGDEIKRLYVHYQMRGKGIGKRLLGFVEGKARQRRVQVLRLNSTPIAVTFYQKQGYDVLREYQEKADGVEFALTKMEKKS